MEKIKIENVKQIDIKVIKPYWRNSRDNKATVEVLKESIRKYGFNVPITIDDKNVIIAGHSRFNALTQLGYKGKIPCVVKTDLTENEVKEYRIADNKIPELTEWYEKDLVLELREIGNTDEMQQYFPQINLDAWLDDSLGFKVKEITDVDIEKQKEKLENQMNNASETRASSKVLMNCPHCLEEFYVNKQELN